MPTDIYDNPYYFDKSYDNLLFVPTIDMHDNDEFFLESLYDNALDDGPMLLDDINYNATENGIGEVLNLARRSPIPFESDQSSCYTVVKSWLEEVMILNIDPTILELDMNYVLIDHEKHALCDRYIVDFGA